MALVIGTLIVIVFLGVILLKISSLGARLSEIEDIIANSKLAPKSTQQPEFKVSQTSYSRSVSKTAESVHHHTEPKGPDYFGDFITWLKTDWLMKLGALFVLMAIVWFVRYAIVNNWIGEMGRVAMGIIVGAGILLGGFTQLKKRPIPGQVLMSLGAVAILFTVYIARNYYDIFTPQAALGIMAFTAIMVAVVAVVNHSLSLAVTAFLGGMIAPMLINSNEGNYLFLNMYILILDCGIFGIVAIRGWRVLLPMALVATGIYSMNTFNAGNLTQFGTWAFMWFYYSLFFIGTFTAILASKKITVGDLLTTVGTVILGIMWVSEYVPDEWKSMVLAVAILFAVVAAVISIKIGAPKKVLYLSGAAAIALLGAATSFELEDQSLVIALALEFAGIIALIRYALFDAKATLITSLLLVIPALLSIESFTDNWADGVLNEDFFTLLVVGASICYVATMIYTLKGKEETKDLEDEITKVSIVEFIISIMFFVGLVWRALEAGIVSDSAAHGTALVIYTIAALTLFFIGLGQQSKTLRFMGLGILIGVILRLLFVEVWEMTLTARTITFVAIGILLITTAFFQKKQGIINK